MKAGQKLLEHQKKLLEKYKNPDFSKVEKVFGEIALLKLKEIYENISLKDKLMTELSIGDFYFSLNCLDKSSIEESLLFENKYLCIGTEYDMGYPMFIDITSLENNYIFIGDDDLNRSIEEFIKIEITLDQIKQKVEETT